MPTDEQLWFRLAIALGIGLLIGVERERRKGTGPTRSAAGIRTFAVVSLLGAASITLCNELMLAVAAVAGLVAIADYRSGARDPGLTTEAALLLTLLLGALAVREPAIAAGIGIGVAVVLAARRRIHHFVRKVLTEDEFSDALVLAAATLVILPLIPDNHIGSFQALNPRTAWIIVILMLVIGALGHIALRVRSASRSACRRICRWFCLKHGHHRFDGQPCAANARVNATASRRRCALERLHGVADGRCAGRNQHRDGTRAGTSASIGRNSYRRLWRACHAQDHASRCAHGRGKRPPLQFPERARVRGDDISRDLCRGGTRLALRERRRPGCGRYGRTG